MPRYSDLQRREAFEQKQAIPKKYRVNEVPRLLLYLPKGSLFLKSYPPTV
jgi:hypothetical protein